MRHRRRSLRVSLLLAAIAAVAVLAVTALPTDAARRLGVNTSPPALPASGDVNSCLYRIHRGDNLFRIGLRYGVSYHYLASLNGIPNPNLIYAGALLAVPCGTGPGPVPNVPPANCAPPQTYDVQPGDNLFRIALNHETGLELVRSANGLYGRVLRPGMHLTIPCPGSVKYRQVPPPEQPAVQAPPPEQPQPAQPQPPANQPLPGGPVVSMGGNGFTPNPVQIKVGQAVTWINTDTVEHTVTSGTPGNPTGIFDSGPINPGGSFTFTFQSLGLYDYFSSIQPTMTGRVTVTQ